MSSKTIVSIYIVLIVINKSSTEIPQNFKIPRIVQGNPAFLGQFPYVCFLENWSTTEAVAIGWVCTGTILTESWVLTAQHCYSGFEQENVPLSQVQTQVKAGTTDRGVNSKETQKRLAVKYSQVDPDPNLKIPRHFNNDIIILQLDKPLVFNAYIGAITGISRPFPSGQKAMCTVMGYGRTVFSMDPDIPLQNTKLHFAYVTVDGDPQACKKRALKSGYGFNNDWSERHICAEPVEVIMSPCNGDSGGPLVCNGLLAGVSSGRLNEDIHVYPLCGRKGNYHIYMFVGMFEEWMRRNIRDLPPFRPYSSASARRRSMALDDTHFALDHKQAASDGCRAKMVALASAGLLLAVARCGPFR